MPYKSSPTAAALINILERMHQDHINLFILLLSEGPFLTNCILDEIYSLELNDICLFFKNNKIDYLAGVNSKNFQITPSDSSTSYILKLDCNLSDISVDIRSVHPKLNAYLTPVYYQHLATFMQLSKYKTVQIQILPLYCGDIDGLSTQEMTLDVRLKNAIHIYLQMAQAYEAFRQEGLFFSDGKNANWLLDEKNTLYIADMKWVLNAPEGTYYCSLNHFKNYYMGIPENPPYVVDKIHALHLGKNLYQYLTMCPGQYLSDPTRSFYIDFQKGCEAHYYDFSGAIFQTPVGAKLKDIIISTVKLNPQARRPVSELLGELIQLKSSLEKKVVSEAGFFKPPTISAPKKETVNNTLTP